MTAGNVVVVSDSGGVREYLQDGVNGYILDARDTELLANRINAIISDDELSRRMRKEALNTSKEYSYDSIGSKYYDLICKSKAKEHYYNASEQ